MRRRRAILPVSTALAVLLLSGCSFAPSGEDAGGVPEPDVGVEAPSDGEGVAPQDEEQSGQDQQVELPDEDRSVVTTGWLALTVDDPIASAAEVADLVERADGRVESRSETPGTDTQQARATLVVRVPADDLDEVLADLRELGEVSSVELDASDVTQERQDLDARIEALQASVDRLLALLAEADTTADLVAIESELTTRQAELDSLTSRRDWLVDQVDYSTLTVDLLSEGVAPQAGPDDFWSGVAAGWDALVRFASALLVVAGVLLPWLGAVLVIGGVVTGIVLLALRARRRAHRGHGAPAAAPTEAQQAGPDPAGRA